VATGPLSQEDTPEPKPIKRRPSVIEPRRRPGTLARAIDRELKARKEPEQLALLTGVEP
jgi:hypothetical protein